MSQIIRFTNKMMIRNGLILPFVWPGKLFNAEGKDITGPVVEVDLDTGRVVYRTALLDRLSITKKRDQTVQHKPPLKLMDAAGRSWQGVKE